MYLNAQYFCLSSRPEIQSIVGYVMDFITQRTNKKTSQQVHSFLEIA